MANIVKPLVGKPGWNVAVDAAIDKVNAHDANPVLNANTAGTAVGGVLAVTQVDGSGNATAFAAGPKPINPFAAAIIFGG